MIDSRLSVTLRRGDGESYTASPPPVNTFLQLFSSFFKIPLKPLMISIIVNHIEPISTLTDNDVSAHCV